MGNFKWIGRNLHAKFQFPESKPVLTVSQVSCLTDILYTPYNQTPGIYFRHTESRNQ